MVMKGTTFGQWTIEELIEDSGGNGVVWRVSNAAGHVCALKMLKSFADPNKASKRRKRFVNEISKLEMIKKMGIAGVMPIVDYDAEHEPPWFVMPLASRLSPTGDQIEWALTTMISVSECVAQLHKEGMVHRDIKPSNLLVLDGSVVISDFGLARIIGDEINTRTGEGVGSFGYIAPECVGPSDEPQFKCDVYALAKTAWALFMGANAPPVGELREPQDSLANRELKTSSINLKLLDELLISSTARDPADRPTAQQFLDS
jgi:serine/threonine protein kinase